MARHMAISVIVTAILLVLCLRYVVTLSFFFITSVKVVISNYSILVFMWAAVAHVICHCLVSSFDLVCTPF